MATRRQATRKPRSNKKVNDAFKVLAEMAAATGADIKLDSIKENLTTQHVGDNQETARRMQGTGMLSVINNGTNIGYAAKDFFTYKCRRPGCERTFMTNYKYDKYCSSACTRDDLRRFGFDYDETKPIEDRWSWQRERWNIPLKIPSSGFESLVKFAEAILEAKREFDQRQEDEGKPGAATHYLWKDRGLNQKALDEFYPIDRESKPEVPQLPESPEPQSQEEPKPDSPSVPEFSLPDLDSLLEDDLDF